MGISSKHRRSWTQVGSVVVRQRGVKITKAPAIHFTVEWGARLPEISDLASLACGLIFRLTDQMRYHRVQVPPPAPLFASQKVVGSTQINVVRPTRSGTRQAGDFYK